MAKISAPNDQYNGVVAGVRFVDGKGETDDERALAYFQRRGYEIDAGKQRRSAKPAPADDQQ